MVKRCRDFGRDLARGPVEVGPTTHFMMGGVVIDAACRTGIENLFAAGEDAGGVHGANRLGGNGVAESTVFGGIAGDVMAEAVVGRAMPTASRAAAQTTAARAMAPLGRRAGADLYALQRSLRDVMWDRVGLVRDGEGLREALDAIDRIERGLDEVGVPGGMAFNVAWHDWLDLTSQVTAARLIATSAVERRESRGAHYRRDFPGTDADIPYMVRVRRDGDAAAVWREPVALTRLRPLPAAAVTAR
jgi:fumarate reductase flavoprotein subunit